MIINDLTILQNERRNKMSAIKKKLVKSGLILLSLSGVASIFSNSTTVSAQEEVVTRIQGETRFDTAALISDQGFTSADTVFITNAREFADALAGVPLAYQLEAPILLAQGNALNQATINEINALGAREAVILGGEAAVSTAIENELSGLGLRTRRLAGDTRFDTAEAIAEELATHVSSDTAAVVDGFDFADAMSIAPFAAQEGMPIYLSHSHRLTSEEALEDFHSTYVVGGPVAISNDVENQLNNPTRLEGNNRFATNIAVMDYFGVDNERLFISTGQEFADALTGSVLAARQGSAVGLVRNGIREDLSEFIDENDFFRFTIFGGETAVPQQVIEDLPFVSTESEDTVSLLLNDLYAMPVNIDATWGFQRSFGRIASRYIGRETNPGFQSRRDKLTEMGRISAQSTMNADITHFEQISPLEYRLEYSLSENIIAVDDNEDFTEVTEFVVVVEYDEQYSRNIAIQEVLSEEITYSTRD